MQEYIIKLDKLTKKFGTFDAVNQVNLEIPRCCFALIGPNGSGKSTIISMLLGLSRPSEGTGTIFQYKIWKDREKINEIVGFVPEYTAFNEELTAYDLIKYTLGLRLSTHIPEQYLEEVEISRLFWRKKIKTYSRGMKQRLAIGIAIAANPPVLILDEPLQNLDPIGRESMIKLLRKLRIKGTTILFTSHVIQDIQEIADYIAIINRGKIKFVGHKLLLAQTTGVFEFELKSPNNKLNEIYTLLQDKNKFQSALPYLLEDSIIFKSKTPYSILTWAQSIDREVLIQPTSSGFYKIYEKAME